MIKFKQRMYCFTMCNISEIQKGIQCAHALANYSLADFTINGYAISEEYLQWVNEDKTIIILNGGTSNTALKIGIPDCSQKLNELGIAHSAFEEPDLNNAISALCFLVDERVWDKETYPYPFIAGEENTEEKLLETEEYVKLLGGVQNVKLREFLKNFRLA